MDGTTLPHDRRGFIHKRLIGGLSGLVTGGPLAAVAGFAGGGRTRTALGPGGSCTGPDVQVDPQGNCVPSASARARMAAQQQFPASVTRVPGLLGLAQRGLPFGATGFEVGFPAQQMGLQLACPSGFHPNKSTYWTQSEGTVMEGTKCVRNRRRNPLNPRAARRSMSRLVALSGEMKRLEKTLRKIAPRR